MARDAALSWLAAAVRTLAKGVDMIDRDLKKATPTVLQLGEMVTPPWAPGRWEPLEQPQVSGVVLEGPQLTSVDDQIVPQFSGVVVEGPQLTSGGDQVVENSEGDKVSVVEGLQPKSGGDQLKIGENDERKSEGDKSSESSQPKFEVDKICGGGSRLGYLTDESWGQLRVINRALHAREEEWLLGQENDEE